MIMKKYTSLTAALLIGHLIFAQQVPMFTQYYTNPLLYNPALTGTGELINATVLHRTQWNNMPGAPVNTALTIDGPFMEKKIGIGLGIFNENTDMLSRLSVMTNYSYRLNVNDDSYVLFGLSLGVNDNRIDFSKASVKDKNDPYLFSQAQRKASFDATFGAAYIWKDLEFTLAVPQLMGNKVKFSNYDTRSFYAIHRHYMASLKYNYLINEEKGLSVSPLAVVRYAPSVPLQFDINAVLNWQKYGWFALAYKSGNAVGVNLGARVFDNLSAGYAYDISIGKIGSYPGATHEIMFRYSFGKSSEAASVNSSTDVSDLQNKLAESESRISKNEEEIAKLKQQIEEKKNEPQTPSDNTDNTNNHNSNTTQANNDDKLFKKDFSDDFVDDNGVQMEKGYFVVVGSFKNKANAKNATQLLQKKGIDAKWILNFKKEFINVYISKPATREQAIEDVNKARVDYPDAWILELE